MIFAIFDHLHLSSTSFYGLRLYISDVLFCCSARSEIILLAFYYYLFLCHLGNTQFNIILLETIHVCIPHLRGIHIFMYVKKKKTSALPKNKGRKINSPWWWDAIQVMIITPDCCWRQQGDKQICKIITQINFPKLAGWFLPI